jgi:acetolactate synthase regulatory subunit
MSTATAAEPSTSSVSFRLFTAPEAVRPVAPRRREEPVWCYGVSADPSPGLLPRVLEYVAKRGLVPLAVHASRCVERGAQGVEDTLSVDLQVDGLDPDAAQHVGNCLGQIVGVRHVAMSRRD